MFRAPRGRERILSIPGLKLPWFGEQRPWVELDTPLASAASISQRSTTLDKAALLTQDPLATSRATLF